MSSKNKLSSDTKAGTINRQEKFKANDTLKSIIAEHKAKTGEVIHIVVDEKTTLELPASLSPKEIKERIEIYKKNRASRS